MDKIQQLFIRACKTEDANKRLISLYKRFYGNYEPHIINNEIGHLLSVIVDEYLPMGIGAYNSEIRRFVIQEDTYTKMHPDYKRLTNQEIHTKVLINKIRYTERRVLASLGVTTPLRFRN